MTLRFNWFPQYVVLSLAEVTGKKITQNPKS